MKIERIIAGCLGVMLFGLGICVGASTLEPETITKTIISENRIVEIQKVPVEKVVTLEVVEEVERLPETILTDDEKILIAKLVFAEAGNQDYIGKRLVADVVLNRVQSDGFGDTVQQVIYSPGQFTHPAAYYTDDCLAAVEAECYERLDYEILWFKINGFHQIGEPAYQHGAHYFSR